MAMSTLSDHYSQEFMKAANTAAIGARVETELDIAKSALRQARELSSYAQSLVNQLCGCQPETTADPSPTKEYEPDGLLPQIAQEARRASSDMSMAMGALRRLERLCS